MRDAFHTQCVSSCGGAAELRNLKLADAIGHVHLDSGRTVLQALAAKMLASRSFNAASAIGTFAAISTSNALD